MYYLITLEKQTQLIQDQLVDVDPADQREGQTEMGRLGQRQGQFNLVQRKRVQCCGETSVKVATGTIDRHRLHFRTPLDDLGFRERTAAGVKLQNGHRRDRPQVVRP